MEGRWIVICVGYFVIWFTFFPFIVFFELQASLGTIFLRFISPFWFSFRLFCPFVLGILLFIHAFWTSWFFSCFEGSICFSSFCSSQDNHCLQAKSIYAHICLPPFLLWFWASMNWSSSLYRCHCQHIVHACRVYFVWIISCIELIFQCYSVWDLSHLVSSALDVSVRFLHYQYCAL